MDTAFFNAVRANLYAGALSQAQVNALEAINAAWEQYGDGDDRKLAYIFAVAHHETAQFKYMREIWGPTKAQKGYEGRADLGNTLAGDGKKFAGRGFVQLTGRRNYADWSKRLGLDLVKEPSLVESYPVASRILVQGSMLGTFTGKKLGDYFGDNADWAGARRVINGTDKAQMIGHYAMSFCAALLASRHEAAKPVPAPIPPPSAPTPVTPRPAPAKGRGITGWLILAAVVVAVIIAVLIPIIH